jgi:LasA protease
MHLCQQGNPDPPMKTANVLSAAATALLLVAVSACVPLATPEAIANATPTAEPPPTSIATPLPTREVFPPGELLPYQAQSGDTLPAVASHFNTTVEEILQANPGLQVSTTFEPGMSLVIPAYYLPLTTSPFHALPDSEVIFGPSGIGFNTRQEILKRPGYLSGLSDYAFRKERPAWEVVDVVARNYSIHPRLLLTLLEHQTQALTKPFAEGTEKTYPLGFENTRYRGLYRQLLWAAEQVNDGYYGWRTGSLKEMELADGFVARPDSYLNAGSVGLQFLFAALYGQQAFDQAIGPEGIAQTYRELWGQAPEAAAIELMPGNLQQPVWTLPFLPNRIWDFTAGPHFAWGTSLPFGALDFAPPAMEGGCAWSGEWIAAPAPAIVTRSEEAIVELDMDGDGDPRTGWVLFFYHVAEQDRVPAGTVVETWDILGHPSCEGGRSTGTHFHLARRFNGEWLPAAGPLPFILDDWIAAYGDEPYQGTLTRGSRTVEACTCTARSNRILYELPGGATPTP